MGEWHVPIWGSESSLWQQEQEGPFNVYCSRLGERRVTCTMLVTVGRTERVGQADILEVI